ncbi:hypothetical protein RHMOL_Rhmol12G0144200 [Rhododendron molle]|uniref:Uncharacterized protein n=1 Tax=Rhododendron molle TaxID=49168 RepID=A0ACC0LIE2_RHOML|nr:hypothetical protein RHMOL_Rhmol12G0144200 [Rhododendron molle]
MFRWWKQQPLSKMNADSWSFEDGRSGDRVSFLVLPFLFHPPCLDVSFVGVKDKFEGEWTSLWLLFHRTILKASGLLLLRREKQLEGMEADTSKVEVEEVEAAKLKTIMLEVLDVTKLYHYNVRGCRMTVAASAYWVLWIHSRVLA